MIDRRVAALAATVLLAAAPCARAAASAQAVSPLNVSVAGNETQVFSVRFFNAFGQPAVGESVSFSNDACGWFPNGGFNIVVPTDATGLASVTFTAVPQGIGCWVVASAGAQVRFNVLTYIASNAYVAATMPKRVLPGQSFTFDAAAMYGAYNLYNIDIAARIVPGSGTASVSPSTANSGQNGTVSFTVTPQGRGDFQVELAFRDKVQRFPVAMSATPWQDLWWAGPQENGWGMSLVQHRDVLFPVIYAYDSAGNPTWYAMPGGTWNDAHTVYTGALYRPHGAPYTAYDAARFDVGSAVGTAALDFTDPSSVGLDYTIAGVAGRKTLARETFAIADNTSSPDVADMWWGGAQQNGWGLTVLQQYRSLFAVWFTYDASGAPTWFVMPSGYWSDAQTWEGRVYRASGAPWLGAAYDASRFHTTDVGAFRLRFAADGTASFEYLIDGRSGVLALQRQPF